MIESDLMKNNYMETKLLSPVDYYELCERFERAVVQVVINLAPTTLIYTHFIVPQRIGCVQSNYLIK